MLGFFLLFHDWIVQGFTDCLIMVKHLLQPDGCWTSSILFFLYIFLQFVLFNLRLLNPINFALISGITESLYFWHGIIRPQFLSATVYSSLLANLTWVFVVMHNLLFLQLLKILFSCICWQCVLLTCMCQNPLFSCCLKSFVDWWYQFIFTAHAFYAINDG